MLIESGAKLGPYEILSRTGAGGMGEVYRARDTRLGRDVAIKVLPQQMSPSPDVRARFEREARTISQLNHPNICTLYDIGCESGTDYLVMEFIEGESLATRLQTGPLPMAELLLFAGQIADALGKAHLAGVIHRDLKPGNLMLTKSGIKLLDFGLARTEEARAVENTADLPLTTFGALVGTLPYMSPEQLEGGEIDARTDLFAFGCVLFEMATGQRLFRGTNNAAILSSILNSAPEAMSQLNNSVPPPLEKIIRRCIDRDPSNRFSSAAELGEELSRLRDWVRSEALPELTRIIEKIQSLDEGPESWQAFELAREIERSSAGDQQLERLWPEFSRRISITSDPPGASVSIKYYSSTTADWTPMGITPLEGVRYPRGISRVKLELPGFRTVEDILWIIEAAAFGATDEKAARWHYQLNVPESLPAEMELVPGGKFPLFMPGLDHLAAEAMGSFLIDRNPVTNRQYKDFVDAGGYQSKKFWPEQFSAGTQVLTWDDGMAKFTDSVGQPGPAFWELGEYPVGEDDFPVVGLSWFEASAYAIWAGKQLPTVFHWNRVAFTVASSQISPFANFANRGPVPVGTTQSVNRFGVHDMAGNVREWARNECNRPGERFILGGGWNDPEYAFNDAYAQVAFDRSRTNGFRCIRTLEADSNEARLARVIDLPFRDFRNEKPVSDEIFSFFLRQFSYDKKPLDAVVESEESIPLGVWQTIRFAAAYGGEQMVANLFLPHRGKPPLQTVVLFPGSLAIHAAGVGPSEFRRTDYLLKSGRAVMLPVYKGTFQRRDELKSDYPEETSLYKDHVIMWCKDLARSIDYLETRDDLDAEKLAYYGLSWGGAMGAILPAVEKRIKAVILYVAGLNFQRAAPEVDQINYVSRVTQPTLMLNGELDFYFPVETSQLPMFELLGTPAEHKRRLTYPLGHSVPRAELIKEALAWLDRYLGPAE